MPSKAYDKALAQMRAFHLTRKTFSGNGVMKHKDALVQFSKTLGATSGLDYGCGKGHQYDTERQRDGFDLRAALGYSPALYDPAVMEFKDLPPEGTEFDLVWCVDVLECVPEGDMDWEIARMASYARLGLFVTVATYPAKKTLPNGNNSHITVKPAKWWRSHFWLLIEARPELNLKLLVA